MAYTWDKANEKAKSRRDTQYFEMFGNRAIYHDGWMAATPPPQPSWLMGTAPMPEVLNGYKWELYNIDEDYSQNNDLAAKYPDKLKELQELFLVEAEKYQVFPLDNSVLATLAHRATELDGRPDRVHLLGRDDRLAGRQRAQHAVPSPTPSPPRLTYPKAGPKACSTRNGGRFGGYGLYLLKGKPVFTLQPPGGREIPLGRQGSALTGKTHRHV